MLVLTRKKNETIVLTDESGLRVEVQVVRIGGTNVRLGVTAPSHVAVHRREVYEAKQCENDDEPKAA